LTLILNIKLQDLMSMCTWHDFCRACDGSRRTF